MRRFLAPLFFLVLAFLVVPSTGQDALSGLRPDDRKGVERFQLFNACRPMLLSIASLVNDEASIGLTEVDLQAAVESRLRAARLFAPIGLEGMNKTDAAMLDVNVHVAGRTFGITVKYQKVVRDKFGLFGRAATWATGGTGGRHGGDAGYILSRLSRYLDQFLADYLRVNEAACEAR